MFGKQQIKGASQQTSRVAYEKQVRTLKAELDKALEEFKLKEILEIVRKYPESVLQEVINEIPREKREVLSESIKQQAEMDKIPLVAMQLDQWQPLIPFIILSRTQRQGNQYAQYRAMGFPDEMLDGIKDLIELHNSSKELDRILSPLLATSASLVNN